MQKAFRQQKYKVEMESGRIVTKTKRFPKFANDNGKPRHVGPHPKKASKYAVLFWDTSRNGTMVRE